MVAEVAGNMLSQLSYPTFMIYLLLTPSTSKLEDPKDPCTQYVRCVVLQTTTTTAIKPLVFTFVTILTATPKRTREIPNFNQIEFHVELLFVPAMDKFVIEWEDGVHMPRQGHELNSRLKTRKFSPIPEVHYIEKYVQDADLKSVDAKILPPLPEFHTAQLNRRLGVQERFPPPVLKDLLLESKVFYLHKERDLDHGFGRRFYDGAKEVQIYLLCNCLNCYQPFQGLQGYGLNGSLNASNLSGAVVSYGFAQVLMTVVISQMLRRVVTLVQDEVLHQLRLLEHIWIPMHEKLARVLRAQFILLKALCCDSHNSSTPYQSQTTPYLQVSFTVKYSVDPCPLVFMPVFASESGYGYVGPIRRIRHKVVQNFLQDQLFHL
ncbi:hypothetical protein VNO77_39141 [Canavalia gladiata]|uniref:Uncharacterized protein n=1 Tax=Canavalia gladiata TaxID=3824 RepID=A0AAN9KBQ0_CANGL